MQESFHKRDSQDAFESYFIKSHNVSEEIQYTYSDPSQLFSVMRIVMVGSRAGRTYTANLAAAGGPQFDYPKTLNAMLLFITPQ
jgi:hypothetical protein